MLWGGAPPPPPLPWPTDHISKNIDIRVGGVCDAAHCVKMEPQQKKRKSSLPMPPPPPYAPPPPSQESAAPQQSSLPPAVLAARRVAQEAKQRADEAAMAAQTPVSLPITSAHNTLGEALKDVLPVYSPENEDIVAIRLHINGATDVDPPNEGRTYSDTVLWNVHDVSFTPEAFARLTRDEICLPTSFEPVIAEQIRQAVKEHSRVGTSLAYARVAAAAAAEKAAAAAAAAAVPGVAADEGQAARGVALPPSPSAPAMTPQGTAPGGGFRGKRDVADERLVTLNLHVRHESGLELRDKVLWDANSDALTPEAFARTLCDDMQIGELEGAVAFAVREELARANARLIAKYGGRDRRRDGGGGGGSSTAAKASEASSGADVDASAGNVAGGGENGGENAGEGGGVGGGDAGGDGAVDEANGASGEAGADGDDAMEVEPADELPGSVASPGGVTFPGSIVRTERAAMEWSPRVSMEGGPAGEQLDALRKAEAVEAEKRDALRRRVA